MITKEEFRDRVLSHKLSVKIGMQRIIDNLYKRGDNHDDDKLSPKGVEGFYGLKDEFSDVKFGSKEYVKVELQPILQEHYKNNDHHPQHYLHGINGMSLMSLMEMMVDWKSASSAYSEGTFEESMKINKKRFGIHDQLFDILMNTAKELGYLEEGSMLEFLMGGK